MELYLFCVVQFVMATFTTIVLCFGLVAASCNKALQNPAVADVPVDTHVDVPEKTILPTPVPPVEHRMFPSAALALRYVVYKTSPKVIGFGEVHQSNDTATTQSAISRFTNSLLPSISGKTSDLVVETWVSAGDCGQNEAEVTQDVAETTERPETTENETVTLITQAMALNIQPHVLELECEDYDTLNGGQNGVDYLGLLELIGNKIENKTNRILNWRADTQAKPKPIVTIYGGAIHNDANPGDIWKSVTYGPALAEATAGKYVEVDLFVPEFVQSSNLFSDQPWFPIFQTNTSKTQVLLIEQSPSSYIIVFKKS